MRIGTKLRLGLSYFKDYICNRPRGPGVQKEKSSLDRGKLIMPQSELVCRGAMFALESKLLCCQEYLNIKSTHDGFLSQGSIVVKRHYGSATLMKDLLIVPES